MGWRRSVIDGAGRCGETGALGSRFGHLAWPTIRRVRAFGRMTRPTRLVNVEFIFHHGHHKGHFLRVCLFFRLTHNENNLHGNGDVFAAALRSNRWRNVFSSFRRPRLLLLLPSRELRRNFILLRRPANSYYTTRYYSASSVYAVDDGTYVRRSSLFNLWYFMLWMLRRFGHYVYIHIYMPNEMSLHTSVVRFHTNTYASRCFAFLSDWSISSNTHTKTKIDKTVCDVRNNNAMIRAIGGDCYSNALFIYNFSFSCFQLNCIYFASVRFWFAVTASTNSLNSSLGDRFYVILFYFSNNVQPSLVSSSRSYHNVQCVLFTMRP